MTFVSIKQVLFILLVVGLLASPLTATYPFGDDWRDVTPAELAMKDSTVEPGADAEVIFWEVRVDDASLDNLVMKHYLRVKIFTEKGREKYAKVDIPYLPGTKVKNIVARVIKADGTISELTKADVFDREVARKDKFKIKAKSFALPNIETGAIIEYRYDEVKTGALAEDMRMVFQDDVPIQTISYFFKPLAAVRYLTFNMKAQKFEKDKGGFYRATMTNVPAIKEEPLMPPMDEVRSWLLVYYDLDFDKKATATDFWARAGGYFARTWDIKDTLKPGKELKAAAAEIVGGSKAPDEQMAKLYEFCQTKIQNLSYDPTITADQLEEMKPNKGADDTYAKRKGRTSEINELFASLATSLGYETRLAFGGNRSEKFFNVNQAHESFVHFAAAAVKVGDEWKYYSPGDKFVTIGMLDWREEDTAVLLLGYKDFTRSETPMSKPEQSNVKRTGRFVLTEDGTLEGTVSMAYTGHLANQKKLDNYREAESKREEDLKSDVIEHVPTAEFSNITIRNVDQPSQPYIEEYKVRVPNYAQKAGKRLFLQPGFFEYGSSPIFSSATRSYAIFFRSPWSENDDIEIKLPAGYVIDSGESPADIADPGKISTLSINIGVDNDKNLLVYKRKFFFGGGGNVLFPVGSYTPIKNLFDAFNKADTHTLTLRQN